MKAKIIAAVLVFLAAGCHYRSPFPEEEFIRVVAAGDIDAASAMLDKHPALVHARHDGGFPSPLRAAIEKDHVKLAAMLLDRGAVANEWVEDSPQPILLATSFEMLDVLLKNRALPNVHDKFGLTPLHLAVVRDDARSAELLLRHDADPEIADNVGTTPLIRAARDGRAALVRVLLQNDARPDRRDREGRTALDHALMNHHTEIAEIIQSRRGLPPNGKAGTPRSK